VRNFSIIWLPTQSACSPNMPFLIAITARACDSHSSLSLHSHPSADIQCYTVPAVLALHSCCGGMQSQCRDQTTTTHVAPASNAIRCSRCAATAHAQYQSRQAPVHACSCKPPVQVLAGKRTQQHTATKTAVIPTPSSYRKLSTPNDSSWRD
jgi:hypothetical protein